MKIKLKITFLGTIGSALSSTLTYSSILINNDLLLDCGEGTTQKLILLDKIDTINTICITHLHNDHFLGIFSLLWYYWIISQRTRPLKIIGPPQIDYTIRTILKLINTPSNALKFDLDFMILKDSNKFQLVNVNDYIITAAKVEHIPITFAYKVEEKLSNKSLCYTGDTRPVENIIKLSSGCTLLICEATFPDSLADFAHKYYHCTPSDAVKLATQANIRKLALTHISAAFHNENILKKIKEQSEKKFMNEVIMAKDLMTLNI